MSIQHVASTPDGSMVVDIEFVPLVMEHWNIDCGGALGVVPHEGARYYHFHDLAPPEYPDACFNGVYDLPSNRWVWANMRWQGLSDWYGVEFAEGDAVILAADWRECDCYASAATDLTELGLPVTLPRRPM